MLYSTFLRGVLRANQQKNKNKNKTVEFQIKPANESQALIFMVSSSNWTFTNCERIRNELELLQMDIITILMTNETIDKHLNSSNTSPFHCLYKNDSGIDTINGETIFMFDDFAGLVLLFSFIFLNSLSFAISRIAFVLTRFERYCKFERRY